MQNGWGGIRTYPENADKTSLLSESGAKSGALDAENGPKDPDLGAIIDAWPTLPEPIKDGILAMVRAAGG